ncbi:MAG TPA: glycosyltransferase family 4 protein [Roseiarcus sp.]|nr:glycosyltransferase family 4 protein [Roseiarcus sp.]
MPRPLNPPIRHLLMTTDTVGGVWTYALDLSRALARRSVSITLAVLGPRPSDAQRREGESVKGLKLVLTDAPLDWLSDEPDAARGASALLSALARDLSVDLVQLNGAPFAAEAEYPAPVVAAHHSCLATWWASAKHGPPPPEWRWRADLVRRHLEAADRVVAPSAAFAALTTAMYGLSRRIDVVHNGRSRSGLAPVDKALDALFTAGRLWDEGKNVATLDRVAAAVDAPFFAAGPLAGPNGTKVDCRNLQTLGELSGDAVRAWLAKRPIFLSSAVYEPFGLTALEAAQAGCALVLADIPSFRELWDGAALFAPPRDHAAFGKAATALLDDRLLRRRMERAAHERARRYGLEAMGARMIALYEELVRAGAPAPDDRERAA